MMWKNCSFGQRSMEICFEYRSERCLLRLINYATSRRAKWSYEGDQQFDIAEGKVTESDTDVEDLTLPRVKLLKVIQTLKIWHCRG